MCLRRSFGSRSLRVAEATKPVDVISFPNPLTNAVVLNMHVSKSESKPSAVATVDGDGADGDGVPDAKKAKQPLHKGKGKGSQSAADKAAADKAALEDDAVREAKRVAKKEASEEKKRDEADSLAFAAWQSARGGPHKNTGDAKGDAPWFLCKNTTQTFARGASFHSSLCAFSAR